MIITSVRLRHTDMYSIVSRLISLCVIALLVAISIPVIESTIALVDRNWTESMALQAKGKEKVAYLNRAAEAQSRYSKAIAALPSHWLPPKHNGHEIHIDDELVLVKMAESLNHAK